MPQWNRFRNIDLIYFHRLNISYYGSFYMDFKNPDLLNFVDRFYRAYRTQPYRISPRGYNLSVYGYDLMYTFVNALARYGDNMIYFGEKLENDPILGPYRFQRISDYGGHVNSYISIVQFFPDLNVKNTELERRPEKEYRYYRRYSRRSFDD
jgi:hypothetical protein